jgi:hypothetical protein
MKRQRIYWKEDEIERFRELYPNTSNIELSEIFNCELKRIYNLASRIKVKKSDEYLIEHVFLFSDVEKSVASRFQKGHKAWNAGKKGIHMAPQTEFKKGHQPYNLKYDGYESKRDRYWYIRINGKFVLKHRYIWEQKFGKISEGMILKFIDGNSDNIKIENLVLTSKKDHAIQNSIHNYPKEIIEIIKLTKKIENYAKK